MTPDLSTPAGRTEVERVIAAIAAIDEPDPLRRASKLRHTVEPDLAQLALSQFQLRGRAATKFGPAAQSMYFTRDGVEQASRAEVAAHRAGRYADAGLTEVLDLCAGIGGDALAFSRAGLAVEAVEQDPDTAEVLSANLAGFDRARVTVGSAETADWARAESVFLDPSRRTGAGRIFDPATFSPSWDFVRGVLEAGGFAAAKLAPGLEHGLIPPGAEAEWVSFTGGVKEAVVWSARFTEPGVRRRATVLGRHQPASLTDADPAEARIGEIGTFLYEPDGAVLRAGLVQHLAAQLPGGCRIEEHLAYLSADAPVDTPLARGYRVVEVISYSVARLRAELVRREVGTVEIKKRGVDVDPAALRRELKPKGPNSITVLLARLADRRVAALAEPLTR